MQTIAVKYVKDLIVDFILLTYLPIIKFTLLKHIIKMPETKLPVKKVIIPNKNICFVLLLKRTIKSPTTDTIIATMETIHIVGTNH